MKAVLVTKPYGMENLSVGDAADPVPKDGDILISVHYAVLNPVDVNTILNKTVYGLKMDPHIPGVEVFGVVENNGRRVKKGDRVIVYPRWSDGTCRYCEAGREYLCENGGLFGVLTSGGFCEKISVPEKMVVKLPDAIADRDAVSLPVGGLTSYHALTLARAQAGERLLVYGASGNTGVFAVLLGKHMGMEVDAVSSKEWISNFGAGRVFHLGSIPTDLKADVVIDSLGGTVFSDSLNHVRRTGRIVTFGASTGSTAEINIAKIYPNEIQIIGSTGGTLLELRELIMIMAENKTQLPTHKIYPLDQIKNAISDFSYRSEGRILISMV